MAEEFFGSYTFDRGIGYSMIDVWEGPKMFRAVVTSETNEGLYRKEIRDRDPQRLFFRAMAIIKKAPGTKLVLMVDEGEPFPFRVKTEEDEIKEFVGEFKEEHPEMFSAIRKNVMFGPEHKSGFGETNGGGET